MSFRRLRLLVPLLALLAASCGRDRGVLARVDGRSIGVVEYRSAFSSLSPEDQVRVLQPGGRLDLLDRLVTKNLLELASDSGGVAASSGFWIDLYETAWLSRTWGESEYARYQAAGIDTTALMSLARGFRMAIALVPDSAAAASALRSWTLRGPSAPPATSLAPWSARGSSFSVMQGMLLNLGPDLQECCLGHSGSGPFAFPLYGSWAVAAIDTTGLLSDTLPPGVGTLSFLRSQQEEASVSPSSPAIDSLSRHLAAGAGGYEFLGLGALDSGLVLAGYQGGAVTAGEVALLFSEVRPDSFMDGRIPDELSSFAIPQPTPAGPGVDLWFFVQTLAETRWRAARGRVAGLDPDSASVGTMATVENLLRREVIRTAGEPDSSRILDFYSRVRGSLVYPERRSVMLAYVPASKVDSVGHPSDFRDLLDWTPLDAGGNPVPTPAQTSEAFGPMADAIFSADSGVVTGPVETGRDSLRAFFEVIGTIPPDTASPAEVWHLLEAGARNEMIGESFSTYVSELRTRFGVEVDSTALEAVDPWGGSY